MTTILPMSRLARLPVFRTGATILSLLVLSACASSPPTVEVIVARSAEAMGGSGNLRELRTIRFEYQHRNRPLKWEISRPNLVRKVDEGKFVLLFDGLRAGFLKGPAREDGTLEGPHLVPPEDWHHFEMDIAIYIPAFFDYPAEYAGQTSVEGAPAHLLRVILPLGGVAVYAIDAESFLPVRIDLPAWNYSQRLGDFREVGGILYPHRTWNPSDSTQDTVLENLEINIDLDPGLFVFPADIQ